MPTDSASQKIERPSVVTVIALWQFFRAALLITVACVLIGDPNSRWGSLGFWDLIYVASNGGGRPGLLSLPFAIYSIAVGIGLWFLKRWARVVLMVTSGIATLFWLRYLAFDWTLQESLRRAYSLGLQSGFQRQGVYMLIAADALVFLLLAFHPSIAETFGGR